MLSTLEAREHYPVLHRATKLMARRGQMIAIRVFDDDEQ